VLVLRDPWRLDPLVWIHRREAAQIAGELGCRLLTFPQKTREPMLLRLSDAAMLKATAALTSAGVRYIGPGAQALQRCYDKREAARIATAAGIDCPRAATDSFPLIAKPRFGSDSIGVKVFHRGSVPGKYTAEDFLLQEQVIGMELTVAVLHGRAGAALRIVLPEGTPYSFARKYLRRPRHEPLADATLAERVRHTALGIADLMGADWAVRVDFIYVPQSGRLCFLECDAAPLIGPASAFAHSLGAAGMSRTDQLQLLLA
jgi:D-alanine-D-alanine ligase-like ATP-grasp enzyme